MLFVEAVGHRDYTLTQALVMLVALRLHLRQLLVDLAYAWLDSANQVPVMAIGPAEAAAEIPRLPGTRLAGPS
jgi:hypothetical protein